MQQLQISPNIENQKNNAETIKFYSKRKKHERIPGKYKIRLTLDAKKITFKFSNLKKVPHRRFKCEISTEGSH